MIALWEDMAGDERKISSFSNKIKVGYKTTELEAYRQPLAKLQATELNVSCENKTQSDGTCWLKRDYAKLVPFSLLMK